MEPIGRTRRRCHESFDPGSGEPSSGETGRRLRRAVAGVRAPRRRAGAGPGLTELRRLRPLAVVTLALLGFQAAAPWNYAQALQWQRRSAELQVQGAPTTSPPPAGKRGAMPVGMAAPPDRAAETAGRAREALGALRDELAGLGPDGPAGAQGRAPALDEAADALERTLAPLDALHDQVLDDFERVGRKVEAAGLPREIERRHRSALREHRDRYRAMRSEIERTVRLARELAGVAGRGKPAADFEAARRELLEGVATAERELSEMVETPEPPEMDMDRLPHQVSRLEPREPRLDPAEFTELAGKRVPVSGAVAAGSSGAANVLGFAARAALPTPEDLAETPEARLTPDILARAEALGDDPLAIFQFVRSAVEPTPTWGSIQGADACLDSLRCNAFDTASLLIALLRAADVPARYALGTVEVPIGELQALLGGFTDPRAALQFLASSGTPVVAVSDESGLVAAQFEHVWVEAFVDYVPSRGAVHKEGDTWVPLDPSFKRVETRFGIDPIEAVGFDAEGFVSDLVAGATFDESLGVLEGLDLDAVDAQLAALEDDVAAVVDDPAIPDTPLGLLGGLEIVERTLDLFPGALPYTVQVRAGSFAAVPPELRHRLRFEVADSILSINVELVHEASLPELAGRRVSLSYAPATPEDEQTLLALLPQDESDLPVELPGYLIDMRSELRVDGELLATGGATPLGSTGRFRMRFSGPSGFLRTVTNNVIAGSYNVVALNLSRAGDLEPVATRLAATAEQIESGALEDLTKGDVLGDFLYAGGLAYWAAVDFGRRLVASRTRVRDVRLPSEGIFSHVPRVELLFGAPRTVTNGALITDVDSNVFAVQGLDGSRERARRFVVSSGVLGSRAESAIWDASLNGTPTGAGITAVSYLAEATRRGIPVFTVDADNLETVLPLLEVSGSVERTVRDGVNAGRIVIIPQRQFDKDGFRGIGFVVLDPDTGSAAYQISTGLAGGGFRFDLLELDFISLSVTLFGSLSSLQLATALAVGSLSAAAGVLQAVGELLKALVQNPGLSTECVQLLFARYLVTNLTPIVFSALGKLATKLVFAVTVEVGNQIFNNVTSALFSEAIEPCLSSGGDGGSGGGGSGDGGSGDGSGDDGESDGGGSDGGDGSDGGSDGGDGSGDGTDGGDGDGTGGSPIGVSIDDPVVTEGAPMAQAVFTVTLSGALSEPLTLDFSTADGTATAGNDYQARSGSVTLLTGETSRQIAVNVLDDDQVEDDETFRVLLSLPAATTLDVEIVDGEGVATVRDDDASSVVGAANDDAVPDREGMPSEGSRYAAPAEAA